MSSSIHGARERQIIRHLRRLLAAKRLRRVRATRIRDGRIDQTSEFLAMNSARRCENVRCLAQLPPQARFCSRCGSKLDGMTNL
jgi:hypothetical protein